MKNNRYPIRQNNPFPKEEQQKQQETKVVKNGCRVGCGSTIQLAILITILIIFVKECKRADMRLEKDTIEMEKRIKDSKHISDSIKTYQAFKEIQKSR